MRPPKVTQFYPLETMKVKTYYQIRRSTA